MERIKVLNDYNIHAVKFRNPNPKRSPEFMIRLLLEARNLVQGNQSLLEEGEKHFIHKISDFFSLKTLPGRQESTENNTR